MAIPSGMFGMLLGSSGSAQYVAFNTSEKPSPLVSAFESGLTTVKRLLGKATVLELPAKFVATKANVPACTPTRRLKTAEVPEGSMVVAVTSIAGKPEPDTKPKVAPLRLVPFTWKFETTLLKRADLQLMPLTTGGTITVKLFVDVAV